MPGRWSQVASRRLRADVRPPGEVSPFRQRPGYESADVARLARRRGVKLLRLLDVLPVVRLLRTDEPRGKQLDLLRTVAARFDLQRRLRRIFRRTDSGRRRTTGRSAAATRSAARGTPGAADDVETEVGVGVDAVVAASLRSGERGTPRVQRAACPIKRGEPGHASAAPRRATHGRPFPEILLYRPRLDDFNRAFRTARTSSSQPP